MSHARDARVLDGQARFGCSLLEFYRQPALVSDVARRTGILVPPLSAVDRAAPPALGRVDPYDGSPRWIANCPDCRVSAEYVWLAHLLFFCANCGNRSLAGAWRTVLVPADREAIEALLLARPPLLEIDGRLVDPRGWLPGETIEQLQAENELLGVS
jgi:hypothetical protein